MLNIKWTCITKLSVFGIWEIPSGCFDSFCILLHLKHHNVIAGVDCILNFLHSAMSFARSLQKSDAKQKEEPSKDNSKINLLILFSFDTKFWLLEHDERDSNGYFNARTKTLKLPCTIWKYENNPIKPIKARMGNRSIKYFWILEEQACNFSQ